MTTATRGNEAEAAILTALIGHGFDVLVPFGGGQPYDLVVDIGEAEYLRVQCKTAWARGGCMIFNSRTTDHGRGRQPYFGLADIFGVYFPPTRAVYLVPLGDVALSKGWLRLEPPKNNQRKRIRFAADYAIDRWSVLKLREHVPRRGILGSR
jgi:hypothetical protein